MKTRIITIAVLLFSTLVQAQDYHLTGGQAALGHTAAGLPSVWSVFYNPGALGEVEGLEVGAFFDARYTFAELGIGGFGAVVPVSEGRFGLSVINFGNSLYREQMVGAAYGRRLSEKFSAGIKLNLHSLQLGGGYGSRTTLSGDLGFLYHLNQDLSLVGSLHNPSRANFSDYDDERLPVLLKGGFRYAFSDDVFFSGEVWKEWTESAQVRAGLSYRVIDRIFLQAGAGTQPTLFSFGVGYRSGPFQLNLASSYHNTLGFSPQLSLSYARGS